MPITWISLSQPGGAWAGDEKPKLIITVRAAAKILIVEGIPDWETNLTVRGRHNTQHATTAMITKLTVQREWLLRVLNATDNVTLAEAQVIITLIIRPIPAMISRGLPPMIPHMSTTLTT